MSRHSSRPLVITDCDEVLLHMVRHFRDWLGEEHGIDFVLEGNPFAQSMFRKGSTEPLSEAEMWDFLGWFFDHEMGRQTEIAGAVAAITELQRNADVVVLTNLQDKRNEARTRQLLDFGITAQVYTNQGPKGGALAKIVAHFKPSRAVFIDDIAAHHASAAEVIPHIARLHFCGEPAVAPHIPCAHQAGHADARIDSWDKALPWLIQKLHGETA
jgi:FMN phosphatase YigB (HAD superfamily)